MISEQKIYMNCMLRSCEQEDRCDWERIRPHAENEFKALLLMVEWVSKMQRDIKMSTTLARIYINTQKNTMRNRLMALGGITLKDAEHIINHALDSIKKEMYEKTDGVDYLMSEYNRKANKLISD